MKKIVAVSKKKFKKAKKFILNIGNKKQKKGHKKSWIKQPSIVHKKK